MPLKNWSVTAGSNTTAAPNGAPEGMTMASVNDTIRQVMADVRTLAAPTTLAAATTTDIGSKDETIITLTGIAVTITGLGTVSSGIYKFVIYNAAHTLTHNATSLILLGGANRTVAAGSVSLFESEGSGNWREMVFQNVNGKATIASAFSDVTGTAAITQGGTGQTTATNAFDALAPTTTQGDIIYHNGTDNVRLAKGTASQVLKMNAGATAPEWASSGSILQVVNTQSGALAQGTTILPCLNDDTIPQITEGDEYMTRTITPVAATSNLKIDVVFWGNEDSNVSSAMAAALFRDATAGALAAGTSPLSINTDVPQQITFTHWVAAGSATLTTFRVRAGMDQAGTFNFNGGFGGRAMGGVLSSSITVTEIAV